MQPTSFSSRLGILLASTLFCGTAFSGSIEPTQMEWHKKYKTQENAPKPEDMLLNTEPEPDLKDGFLALFNGKDLDGWEPKGGNSTFTVKDGILVGTCVPDTESTYLCTKKTDYTDFIFTCDMRWEVDINTGVMFHAQQHEKKGLATVLGPQAEMEGTGGDRHWSGGIYGQDCGGYFYPMWLVEHAKARAALVPDGWNRLTIECRGNVVRTWLNGVPAAHWQDDGTYAKGFFGLQIHKAKKGEVHWRKILLKDLSSGSR
jgi:hypothetical protein